MVDLRKHCGHGKPVPGTCLACEKMDKIMNDQARKYEGIIAFVSEWHFLGLRDEEIDNDNIVTLLATIYNKDELRVIHDIKKYLKKRG